MGAPFSGLSCILPGTIFAARPCLVSGSLDATDIRFCWGERSMFEFRDLFQWDRFITPTIIKTFYWLVIALIGLFGIAGIFSGLAAMASSPLGGVPPTFAP